MNRNNGSVARDIGTDNYKYKFSIIMAVYKVEEFIEEAIESVIAQDVGFSESVQLILVDDGSPDSSGAICDRYAEKYPDNIKVIHKENGGLCSARNEGLKYIEGRYVNFFDPDDILSENTLSDVYSFFIENEKYVDIVSIPLFYFGDRTGPHHLNNKFDQGTRIVNLEKEFRYSHISAASSFFRHEIAKGQYYDPRLVVGEDAEVILKALVDNPLLGVVSTARYMYRRREGSQVTAGKRKKGWYTDYVRYLSLSVLEYAKQKRGYIPRYIQNSVMGDLRWKFTETALPDSLNGEEIAEYREALLTCLGLIDDDLIMAQKGLVLDAKIAMLYKKHGEEYITYSNDDIIYGFDSASDWAFSRNTLQLCFVDLTPDSFVLRTRQVVLSPFRDKIEKMQAVINGDTVIDGEFGGVENNTLSIGEAVSFYVYVAFRIPRELLRKEECRVRFRTIVDGVTVECGALRSGYLFPVSVAYKNSYALIGDSVARLDRNELILTPSSEVSLSKLESSLCSELWRVNRLGTRKAAVARRLAAMIKKLIGKPIWIVSDRLNKAGDNGEALFRYLKESKEKRVKVYYAITNCPDAERLRPLGDVIDRSSSLYKLLFLAADVVISSHADDFVINPFFNYFEPYRDIIKQKKFVFLQHGVTQNDISGWLNRYSKNIYGFITTAYPETRSLKTYAYHYEPESIWEVGFARFDRLYSNEKKYVTLMPTWRRYLASGTDADSGVWNLAGGFKDSAYFKFYNALINDSRLLAACEEFGYTLCFMPHPNIIPHIDNFDRDERVIFFSIDKEYRDVYAESNLVLTDYSSAAFDFAYMRKPIIYSQFDADEFFAGDHVVTRGYFDYERDGFGEVTKSLSETVDTLISYIKSGCKLKDKYRERIDSFFVYSDKENSKRITEKIISETQK